MLGFREKKAILFDLDGTLIDSMLVHLECWSEILNRYEVNIEKDEFLAMEGTKITELMGKYTGLTDPRIIAQLISEKDSLFLQRFSFKLYGGVAEFLSWGKEYGLTFGLVTSSSTERFYKSAPTSFCQYFSTIITGSMLPRGKPNPDQYLAAIGALNFSPRDVLAVENAPLGIKAAKGAGIDCIAVEHTVKKPLLMEADFVYETFETFSAAFLLSKSTSEQLG